MRRTILAALAAAAIALPAKAATPVSLRLGGDYLLDGGPGIFSIAIGLEKALGSVVSVGGRFGAMLTTSPTTSGIPIDVFLRFRLGRAYFEGLGGPWGFFEGETLRGHAAVGLGLLFRSFEFGTEVGFLSPDRAQVGARIGFRL